jgi:uncharacterized OB-fold protein
MKKISPAVVKGMLSLKNEIVQLENERVLLTPRMFGVPQMVADGEQSRWLLPLMEDAKMMGARCPKCGQIYAPAYLEFCGYAPCRFAKLELIELPDVGAITDADPVITLFAPARMDGDAPFAHGYVELKKGKVCTTVHMMFALETRTGVIRPGIFKAGTKIKLVFQDKREGWIRDVFCVPQKELTKAQIAKTPLFVSDLDWSEPKPPKFPASDKAKKAMANAAGAIKVFFEGVNKSPRNKARLKALNFEANIVTAGGSCAIAVKKGAISLLAKPVKEPATTLAIKEPKALEKWTKGLALTNEFALGALWLSNREGIRVLEDLDRLWRAATRDGTLQ